MAAITQSFLEQIESYDSCLGSGAFGIVIKVTASNKEESAIKILFPDNVEPKEQKRMLREVLTVGFERNDNIVQILNFESKTFTQEELKVIFQVLPHNLKDYKQLYLSRAKRLGGVESLCVQMELCGENLKTWLDKDKDKIDPSIEHLQAVIPKNVIDGLKFLHDHKIIHRDLKPANILFSSSNFCLPVKIGKLTLLKN
jgi:serine/threonine protein kinase